VLADPLQVKGPGFHLFAVVGQSSQSENRIPDPDTIHQVDPVGHNRVIGLFAGLLDPGARHGPADHDLAGGLHATSVSP
jgi:hypothetical protein